MNGVRYIIDAHNIVKKAIIEDIFLKFIRVHKQSPCLDQAPVDAQVNQKKKKDE